VYPFEPFRRIVPSDALMVAFDVTAGGPALSALAICASLSLA
jgi:hypothetical protein